MGKKELSEVELKSRIDLFEQDLESLYELIVTNSAVQVRHVRQASVIVRRWLCDNELSQITRGLGVKATLPILDDDHIFQKIQSDADVCYYLSSVVKFNGKAISCIYYSESDLPPSWSLELTEVDFKELPLGKILSKRVLYFDNETFKLGDVLRFACNKLGGAHYDSSRNDQQLKIENASNYLTIGGQIEELRSNPPSEIHLVLEPDSDEWLNGVYVVVISAAAMLLNISFNGQPLIALRSNNDNR